MSTPGSNDAWPWRRGVIYTVRPEILAPLAGGREYRILIGVRRMVRTSEPFTAYGELYRRAAALTDARVAALVCPAAPVARWTASHGWRAVEFGERQFIFVFITTVVSLGGEAQAGERAPTGDELTSPGGALREMPMQQPWQQNIDEFYNDFDHRAAGDSADDDDLLFSYGEYVPSSETIDFEPFAHKAETMARSHYGPDLRVVQRDCFCATHPNVAVVHLVFRSEYSH